MIETEYIGALKIRKQKQQTNNKQQLHTDELVTPIVNTTLYWSKHAQDCLLGSHESFEIGWSTVLKCLETTCIYITVAMFFYGRILLSSPTYLTQ